MNFVTTINGKTYKFTVDQMHSTDYFSKVDFKIAKYIVVGSEGIDKEEILVNQSSEQITIDIDTAEKRAALNTLLMAAVTKLQSQLASPGITELPIASRFRNFYNALLTSKIFQYANQQAKTSIVINVAYTDFSTAISLCINGGSNGNIPPLQSAVNALITSLGLAANSPLITEVKQLIDQHKVPIIINL